MIKFLFLLILVLLIFLLIYIIKHLKHIESLKNYQRILYNDNGEVLEQGLYLKQTPLSIYKEKKKLIKGYTILGEDTKQDRILINIFVKFFKFKPKFYKTYEYNSNDILKKISSNEFNFGIIDESSLLISFIEFNKNNFIYKSKYNILNHYAEEIFDTSKIRYVCSLYNVFLTFIASASSNIISSSQIIIRHRIGVVNNSIDLIRLKQYLEARDLSTNQIILFNDLKSLMKGLEFNKIDILFMCCGHPQPLLEDIFKKKKIVIIDCNDDIKIKKISYLLPGIRKNIITEDVSYNGLHRNIVCLSLKRVLITNIKTDKWAVLQFLYNFFNNFNYIGENTDLIFENGNKFPTKSFIYYISKKIKYHEGARLFYKNQGLIINTTSV